MNLENGKTYLVDTQRKGRFVFKAESQSDEWVVGRIVAGKARAMLQYNEREAGDEITLRKEFIKSAVEQP